MFKHVLLITFAMTGLLKSAEAVEYEWPVDDSRLIGENVVHVVKKGEFLEQIAKKYNVVFLSLLSANHNVDPYLLQTDRQLTIPRQLILPDTPKKGIVVNLPEFRLYYYQPEFDKVHVFPIGIGRVGRETPLMKSYIVEKREFPDWIPTKNIKKEYLEKKGIVLPDVVPPGPDNPLGTHALRLAGFDGLYSIHGTNKSFGIGLRVSSGCIRMRPADIQWLFDNVEEGVQVRIIDQPVKTTFEPDGGVYVEAHRPLSHNHEESEHKILTLPDPYVSSWLRQHHLNDRRYLAALSLQTGLPTEIGRLQ